MTEHEGPSGERLVEGEPFDPALRESYGAALREHFDRRLTVPPRTRYAVVGLAGLAGCLICGSLAITEPATMPPAVRSLLVLFAFFGLGWTLLGARALSGGGGDFMGHRTAAARMAFGFTLAAVVALSVVSSLSGRPSAGVPMVATGLAMLILATVVLLDARIERCESRIREQILRVESRLAAMSGPVVRETDGREDHV